MSSFAAESTPTNGTKKKKAPGESESLPEKGSFKYQFIYFYGCHMLQMGIQLFVFVVFFRVFPSGNLSFPGQKLEGSVRFSFSVEKLN